MNPSEGSGEQLETTPLRFATELDVDLASTRGATLTDSTDVPTPEMDEDSGSTRAVATVAIAGECQAIAANDPRVPESRWSPWDAEWKAHCARALSRSAFKPPARDLLGPWYRIYGDLAFGVALHRSGSPERAKDIVQSAIVIALEQPTDAVPAPLNFPRWMSSTLRYTYLNFSRKKAWDSKLHAQFDEARHPTLSNDAEDTFAVVYALHRAATFLTLDELHLLQHRHASGYTLEQIADFFDCAPSTVKRRLDAAYRKLRNKVTGEQ